MIWDERVKDCEETWQDQILSTNYGEVIVSHVWDICC